MVVATHVRTPQLLNQDPNDADEQDKVHLGDREGITGVSEQLKRVGKTLKGWFYFTMLDSFPPTESNE